jgi:hypothetical protein
VRYVKTREVLVVTSVRREISEPGAILPTSTAPFTRSKIFT